MSEATEVSSVVTYIERLPTKKVQDHLNKWLCEATQQFIKQISFIAILIAIKLVRVVTYCEKLPPYVNFIFVYRDIICEIKKNT